MPRVQINATVDSLCSPEFRWPQEGAMTRHHDELTCSFHLRRRLPVEDGSSTPDDTHPIAPDPSLPITMHACSDGRTRHCA
jgi:hypothetical protein